MAVGRVLYKLSVSTIIVLFIPLILINEPDKNLANDVTSIFVVTNMGIHTLPSRNSGVKRRQCSTGIKSPSCKVSTGINLMKLFLGASYLVLLSGDISLNPGPITDPCVVCKKGCRRNQRAVQWDECDLWCHAKYAGITNEKYENIAQPGANWSCIVCLFPGLNSSVTSEPLMESSTAEKNSLEPNLNIHLLRGLKIAHLNVNRLVNKIDSIKELLSIYSFGILALTETWMSPDITNDEIYIPGYSIFRRDRQNSVKSCGGGTLVFARDSIPFVVKSDFMNNTDFESIWLEINRSHCKCLTLCCIYRPGDQNIDEFISYLDHCLEDVDLDNSEVILTGDFNVDYSTKKNSLCRKLDEFASKNSLSQIFGQPTRVSENSSPTTDLILVNNVHRIVQCDVLYSNISDHNPVFCVLKGGVKKLPPEVFEYRSFKNFDNDRFLRDLKNGVQLKVSKILMMQYTCGRDYSKTLQITTRH